MVHAPVLILENLRSAENVGSIFRTADGAGVAKIYCAGITPAPRDRFGRWNQKIAKAALGAEQSMVWEHVAQTTRLVRTLKTEGYTIIALEQAPHARDWRHAKPRGKWALVVGNEVAGVSPTILKLADVVAEIPLRGMKESLNVAVATGIALFTML